MHHDNNFTLLASTGYAQLISSNKSDIRESLRTVSPISICLANLAPPEISAHFVLALVRPVTSQRQRIGGRGASQYCVSRCSTLYLLLTMEPLDESATYKIHWKDMTCVAFGCSNTTADEGS